MTALLWIGLVFISALIPLLYSRNAASADGRLLTYRTMWNLCLQRPLCGWGSNAIDAHYTAAQAHALQAMGEGSEYAWLAGDVVRPFNELLAWCMKYGLVGTGLVLAVIWMMWKSCSQEHRVWMASLCIGWGVLGCFSYPSYYPYVRSAHPACIGSMHWQRRGGPHSCILTSTVGLSLSNMCVGLHWYSAFSLVDPS